MRFLRQGHPAVALVRGWHDRTAQYCKAGGVLSVNSMLGIFHRGQADASGNISPEIIETGGGLFHFAIVAHHAQPAGGKILWKALRSSDEYVLHPVPEKFAQTALREMEEFGRTADSGVGVAYLTSDEIDAAFEKNANGTLDLKQLYLYQTKI